MKYSGPNPVNLGHLMTIKGTKRPDSGLFGASKGLVCPWNGPLGAPWGAPEVQKWVIDSYLVNICQLDHYVALCGPKMAKTEKVQKWKLTRGHSPWCSLTKENWSPPKKKDPQIAKLSQKEPNNRKNVFFQKMTQWNILNIARIANAVQCHN